jgi:two-component system, OmpR family, sensor histidine kinase KdpD
MKLDWHGYAWALAATAVATAAGLAMTPRFDLVNVAMVYLLAVVMVALRHSRGAAVLASCLCVVTFDFLFVPPVGTFTVDDAQYVVTFAIMVGVAVIISSLAEASRRQARAQAALEIQAQTERMRSVLLASISHDLRTPLAVMAGASSTLAERGEAMSAEERQSLAASVFAQASEMSEHVSKVLQMTRLESGAVRAERDWASIGEIAGAVLARLAMPLAGHRVLVEIPDDLPLARVDAGLIGQALGNLLENAARHTPRETVVRLQAWVQAGEIVVSVEDYGGGLAPQDLERVFEKFHRGTVEGQAGGMGLGLAICRAIVRLHGGRTWAENVPAGGTAFRFSLPLEEMPSPMPSEAAA